MRFLESQTWNEYVVKSCLSFILVLFAVSRVVDFLNWRILNFVFQSTPYKTIEGALYAWSVYSIWQHSKHQFTHKWFQFPLCNYILTSGSLSTSLQNYAYKGVLHLFALFKPLCQFLPAEWQPDWKNAKPTAQAAPAAPAPATTTTNAAPPAPFQPSFEQRDAIPSWSTHQTMPVLRVLDEPETLVEKKDVPKLKYAPCFETRRKPVHRTNKALWQLWPKAETIDRFRDEQLYDFEENWHRFDDRSSKVYYDKLRAWLKTKIISPIVATVDVVNQHLASTNTTFVDCPPPTMALLMLEYQPQGEDSFPISLVYDFITVPKHENNAARQYVLDRIKGMHQRGIFTFYHPNMPSDNETLIHLVYTYLSNRMPHVVPPLVPAQGDTMKFLLLYFYITEELRDEIF